MEDTSKRFLSELTDFEYRVFIMCFALKKPQEQVAKELRKNKTLICETCKQVKQLYQFELIKDEIIESFESQY